MYISHFTFIFCRFSFLSIMRDILSILRDNFVEILSETPVVFLILSMKIAFWLCFSFFFLYFSFHRYNRRPFIQMVVVILLSFFCFFLPLEYVIPHRSALIPFLLCISLLIILVMPRVLAFYITPQRGNQLLLTYIFYTVIVVLFVIQILLSIAS